MIHEEILVLFVYKHDVRAVVIQFLVNLYREIPKYFEILRGGSRIFLRRGCTTN